MTAHEAIFNAINGVWRSPADSLTAANAVLDELAKEGYEIVKTAVGVTGEAEK